MFFTQYFANGIDISYCTLIEKKLKPLYRFADFRFGKHFLNEHSLNKN